MASKPKLGLVPGKKALDLESIKRLYVNLTGKEPTEAELKEAEEMLKKQGEKKSK